GLIAATKSGGINCVVFESSGMVRVMRRRRRKWLRIFWVTLVVALLCAYFNQRGIIVWLANRGNPPLQLDLGRATLHWNRLELSGLVIKLRGSNEEVVRADSAIVGFAWSGLREHRVGAVTIKGPHVRISDKLLDAMRGATTGLQTSAANQTWLIQRLTVIDG